MNDFHHVYDFKTKQTPEEFHTGGKNLANFSCKFLIAYLTMKEDHTPAKLWNWYQRSLF